MRAFVARNWVLLTIAATAFVLDQITKATVVANLVWGQSWPAHGFFRITYISNSGSAFGLFGGQNAFLIFGALAGLAVLIIFYRSHPNPSLLVKASLGLMLAGALGNLTDRIIRGQVIDFISVGPFWIFNVADASITIGLVLLAVSAIFFDQGPAPADDPDQSGDAPIAMNMPTDGSLAPEPERRDDDRRA